MEIKDFTESKWAKAATDPEARAKVVEEFPDWIKKVKDSDLVHRARRLWDYLISDKSSTGDVILVVAALLYLLSPIDAVPDFIPFAGWIDDAAVAGLVLGYLDRKANAQEAGTTVV